MQVCGSLNFNMKIITLTLNPAYDIHCEAERFVPFSENLFSVSSRDAGGKGVNISRALSAYGVKNTAIIAVGRENSGDFLTSLRAEGLSFIAIEAEGRIRENITLHSKGEPETRISFKGFSAAQTLLDSVFSKVRAEVDRDTVLTLTGSLPVGISAKDMIPYLSEMKALGVRTVIDSRSFTAEDIAAHHPWLIKPNEEEISIYSDDEITTPESAALAADKLRYMADNVMISLGAKGAVLATEGGRYFAEAPKVSVLSTVGAGDSSIAGFIAAEALGLSTERSLALAVSFGSAACSVSGTQAPQRSVISALFSDCASRKL